MRILKFFNTHTKKYHTLISDQVIEVRLTLTADSVNVLGVRMVFFVQAYIFKADPVSLKLVMHFLIASADGTGSCH